MSNDFNQDEVSMDIDDSLYSRQRYMLGDQAMKRMMSSKVLLVGCDCLGVEIAKNLVLTGIGCLEVADSQVVDQDDVATNFYVTKKDADNQLTRAAACVPRIQELNQYVNVLVSSLDDTVKSALEADADALNVIRCSLRRLDCVICSQSSRDQQLLLNKICRELGDVKFVCANVYGLFSSIFCDFGEEFEVHDSTGEQLKEGFIGNITNSVEGLVTCFDNTKHGLESGDLVMFEKLKGMSDLNNQIYEIKVSSPHSFTIGDTTTLPKYERSGMYKQIKRTFSVSHESLEKQLSSPNILPSDYGKMENPLITHAAFIALHVFLTKKNRLPKSSERDDADCLHQIFLAVVKERKFIVADDKLAMTIVEALSFSCRGFLSPLCAAIGGIVSQEALKSLTGKYSPLQQWLYIDALELYDAEIKDAVSHSSFGNEICLGSEVSDFLSNLNVFLVGCGAIGCEMLKNLTLLGVSSGIAGGTMTVTDNDTIEKSNLNRQFLFKNKHVSMSKSEVGGSVAKEMRPNLNVKAMQNEVCPGTEESIFTDLFFKSNDIVVNALDNVAARRYVDSRCVSNQLPLIESGTMGPKGHVQVVVPFLTESYSNQSDPPDVQYPFCTLKSFPSRIEHTIQWARDKFESLFSQKPMLYNKFWEHCFENSGECRPSFECFLKYINDGGSASDARIVIKLLQSMPTDWSGCVAFALRKFNVFFNHKARHLLDAFPLDTKLENGSLFWSLPKRPPTPTSFDGQNRLHMQFIISLASLTASVFNIATPGAGAMVHTVYHALEKSDVPHYVPSRKEIITDDSETPAKNPDDGDIDAYTLASKFKDVSSTNPRIPTCLNPEHFEKDDDANHHIDFISATANLRASMYGIDNVDRLEVKRIAGRIIPAICTTTSAVAGFATIQFLQLAVQLMRNKATHGCNWVQVAAAEGADKLSVFRNAFLNLALPLVIFSEPASAPRVPIGSSYAFTEWDRWDLQGRADYKLEDLVKYFQDKVKLEVSSVLQGVMMVYMSFMPSHRKRLGKPIKSLLKTNSAASYVDLTITFRNDDGGDDYSCPRVRYYF